MKDRRVVWRTNSWSMTIYFTLVGSSQWGVDISKLKLPNFWHFMSSQIRKKLPTFWKSRPSGWIFRMICLKSRPPCLKSRPPRLKSRPPCQKSRPPCRKSRLCRSMILDIRKCGLKLWQVRLVLRQVGPNFRQNSLDLRQGGLNSPAGRKIIKVALTVRDLKPRSKPFLGRPLEQKKRFKVLRHFDIRFISKSDIIPNSICP